MTPEERKRGLRAAAHARVANTTLSPDWHISRDELREQILWQIIDSLVEECAEYYAVVAEFMQDVQANGVQTTGVEWPDLLVTYNNARRIVPFEERRDRPAEKENHDNR